MVIVIAARLDKIARSAACWSLEIGHDYHHALSRAVCAGSERAGTKQRGVPGTACERNATPIRRPRSPRRFITKLPPRNSKLDHSLA